MTVDDAFELMQNNCLDVRGNVSSKKFTKLCRDNIVFVNFVVTTYGDTYAAREYWQLLRSKHSGPVICQRDGCNNSTKWDAGLYNFRESCSKKCAYANPARVEKAMATWVERYGEGYGFANARHIDKACNTMRERYGSSFYVETKEFESKRLVTLNDNFGVDYPMQNSALRQRHQAVMLKNHGVTNGLTGGSPLREQALKSLEDKFGARQIMATEYMRKLKEDRGEWTPKNEMDEYLLYKQVVYRFSERTIRDEGIDTTLRGRAEIPNAHHIDHKLSIKHGFDHAIPPYIMGSRYNLKLIPAKENCSKGPNSTLTGTELCDLYYGVTPKPAPELQQDW